LLVKPNMNGIDVNKKELTNHSKSVSSFHMDIVISVAKTLPRNCLRSRKALILLVFKVLFNHSHSISLYTY